MSIPIRVLILEDRPEDAELIVHELRRSQFDPDWRRVDSESEYNAHMGWRPDLILADYSMPLLDASRALALLQELDLDIPFIVVSGAIGEDVAVAMMRQGATDYLLKDRLARLGSAVRHALNEKKLRMETRQAQDALRASEIRFYSFMNNSPALAFIKDEDGRMLYMNNTCEQAWGLSLGHSEGSLDHELWPAEVAARLRSHDLAVLQKREPSRTIEEVCSANGRVVQMLSFRFPFTDAAGRLLLGGVSVDISEQVRAERALAEALAAKDALLKELHHRVKNNLQVVSSLLAMQAESLQATPSARQALEETHKRVRSMVLIHERLHAEEDAGELDFGEYIETLSRDLIYCCGADPARIHLRLELDTVWLELSQATPCGLILNELLTNSLKYAFPEQRSGEILVALSCTEDNFVKLTVADDGVGLPPVLDWRKSPSLGLRIVDILSRQLDAALEQLPSTGTAFCLTFRRNVSDRIRRRPQGIVPSSNTKKAVVSSIR